MTEIKKKNFYLDNKAFESDLAKYYVTRCPDLLNEICEKYFYPLAIKVTNTFGHGYADPQDLIQEGVNVCQERIDRWTPEKGKAFTFFSIIIKNKGKDIRRSVGRKRSREVSIDDYERCGLQC